MEESRQAHGRRARPGSRLLRAAGFAVLPVAVLTTGLLVSTSSYAVFSGRSTNPGNTWATVAVVLQHDAPNGTGTYSSNNTAALFPAASYSGTSGLQPGATRTRCIDVRSTGSIPSGEVRLYASAAAQSIASQISLTVVQGTAGSTCSAFTAGPTLYNGYLNGFATSTTGKDFATGYGTGWVPTLGATEVRAFQFTVTLDTHVSSSVQGTSATTNLSWETQGS